MIPGYNEKRSRCYDIFTSFDIFGQPVYFTIDRRKTSKTIFGGICSIVAALAIIAFGIYTSRDLFMHLDPAISRLDYTLPNYISINTNISTFSMAIAYEAQELESFFAIEATYLLYNSNTAEFIENFQIPLVKCQRKHWSQVTDQQYYAAIGEWSLCLDFENAKTQVDIFGTYSEGLIGFIIVDLSKCYGEGCSSEEEINERISYGNFFTLSIVNSAIDPYNYTHPISYFINNIYLLPDVNLTVSKDVYFKEERIETDDGPIFKNSNVQIGYYGSNPQTHHSHLGESVILGQFQIYASNSQTRTKRIFPRIQDILASVGGIVSIILNGGPALVLVFSWMKKDEHILNQLIDFDIDKESESKKVLSISRSIRQQKSLELEEINIDGKSRSMSLSNNKGSEFNASSNEGNLTEGNTNDLDKKVEGFLRDWRRKRKNKLHFSFCEVIMFWVCPCSNYSKKFQKKKELYKKSQSIVNDYLEITYLIAKLEELEKLKFVVMNNKQLSLFKFIASDICSIDEKKMRNNPIRRNKITFNDEKKMAYEVFQYKKELDSNLGSIKGMDFRLIELLSTKLDLD